MNGIDVFNIKRSRMIGAVRKLRALMDVERAAERERIARAIEALMEVAPREFDAKRAHPDIAYRRCKQPNCNLMPIGIGAVTPDSPRFCSYHEALSEALRVVRNERPA